MDSFTVSLGSFFWLLQPFFGVPHPFFWVPKPFLWVFERGEGPDPLKKGIRPIVMDSFTVSLGSISLDSATISWGSAPSPETISLGFFPPFLSHSLFSPLSVPLSLFGLANGGCRQGR